MITQPPEDEGGDVQMLNPLPDLRSISTKGHTKKETAAELKGRHNRITAAKEQGSYRYRHMQKVTYPDKEVPLGSGDVTRRPSGSSLVCR